MPEYNANDLKEIKEFLLPKEPDSFDTFDQWLAYVLSLGVQVIPRGDVIGGGVPPVLYVSQSLCDKLPKKEDGKK